MTRKGKTIGAAQRPTQTKPKADAYISFNKAETAALQGVCLRSLRVYFELKWLANFRTGVVGAFGRQKLTFEAIAEKVAIPTAQGRSAAQSHIDGKEVSRIIQRLEQAGLVADVHNNREGLTLQLPLSPMRAASVVATETGQPTEQQLQPDAPMPTPAPTQPPEDDDDWDWGEPEAANSPATCTETDGNQAEKLPTDSMPEAVANPYEHRVFSASDPIQSVLVKTEGQYGFSVRGPVLTASARSALADVGRAEAPTEPLGHPHRLTAVAFRGEENPSLDAEQIRERIRARHPGFSYLDTQISKTIFVRIAKLDITVTELDEAAQSLAADPMRKLTADALFDQLVSRRKRPRRLIGGLVL